MSGKGSGVAIKKLKNANRMEKNVGIRTSPISVKPRLNQASGSKLDHQKGIYGKNSSHLKNELALLRNKYVAQSIDFSASPFHSRNKDLFKINSVSNRNKQSQLLRSFIGSQTPIKSPSSGLKHGFPSITKKRLLDSPQSKKLMQKLEIKPEEASQILQTFDQLDMNKSKFATKTLYAPQSTKNHFNFEKNKIRVVNFYKNKMDPISLPQSIENSAEKLSYGDTRQSWTNFNSTNQNLSKNSSGELTADQYNQSFSFTNNINQSKYSHFPKIHNRYLNSGNSRESLKKQQSYYKIMDQFEKASKIRETIQYKREMITDIVENWNKYPQFKKHLTYNVIMEMSILQLQEVIQQLKINTRMDEAATMIQRFFKAYITRKKFLAHWHLINLCASKLQAQWRLYRMRKFRDVMLNVRINKQSVKIQSLLKGLLVSRKYEHVYVKMRLTDNLELFENQQGTRKVNAQILIAYHWRKKLERIRKSKIVVVEAPKPVFQKKLGIQSKIKPYIDDKKKQNRSSLNKKNSSSLGAAMNSSAFGNQKSSKANLNQSKKSISQGRKLSRQQASLPPTLVQKSPTNPLQNKPSQLLVKKNQTMTTPVSKYQKNISRKSSSKLSQNSGQNIISQKQKRSPPNIKEKVINTNTSMDNESLESININLINVPSYRDFKEMDDDKKKEDSKQVKFEASPDDKRKQYHKHKSSSNTNNKFDKIQEQVDNEVSCSPSLPIRKIEVQDEDNEVAESMMFRSKDLESPRKVVLTETSNKNLKSRMLMFDNQASSNSQLSNPSSKS